MAITFAYPAAGQLFKDNPSTGWAVITTAAVLAAGLLLFEYTPPTEMLAKRVSSLRRTLTGDRPSA
jgi:hypothetical protein